MRNIILASVAAFALSSGYANAQGLLFNDDENDRKSVTNLWIGQSEDNKRDRRFGRRGSSTSTFSGRKRFGGLIFKDDENGRKSVTNLWAGQTEEDKY